MRNILASGNSTTKDVVGLLDTMCHFVLFALFFWNMMYSFALSLCNMRFVLQAAARRARGRAGDQHAQDPFPTPIVSTSDCCGAADGGRAERRAAEST